MRQIFIGHDVREQAAFDVACHSIERHLSRPIPIHGLYLADLVARGLYRRPMEQRGSQLWDVISGAPMSTTFACARFLVPHLAGTGWALFADCDILVRADLNDLFALADDRYAVMCVQHEHHSTDVNKMIDQAQTNYARKNWSSVVLYNCDHPANKQLTLAMINALPGRDLHRYCWLEDDEIGALGLAWNWLAGVSPPHPSPRLVHYTLGTPDLSGYADSPYASEWWDVLRSQSELRKAS